MERNNEGEISHLQKTENQEHLTDIQNHENNKEKAAVTNSTEKESTNTDEILVPQSQDNSTKIEPSTSVESTDKGDKLVRRKKDRTIKFTRTEEKISEEDEIHIEESEVHETMREDEKGCCGLMKGPHITFLSILFIPCALISSLCVSFYYGAWTWYNLYIYFSEEKTVWHKVSICPLLILTFPFTVGLTSLFVAIFAAFIQLSWYFRSWKAEILDFDKGFYGWLCDKIGLSQCSPYDMIPLNDDSELENLPIRS